jgi:hypothetical protein
MDTLRRAKFIEAKADEALAKTEQTKPPTDLDAIARHYGVTVRRGARDEGVAAHWDASRNEIVLGEFERWPFAHDIGHALLRHGTASCHLGIASHDAEGPQSDAGDDAEAEANRFARHLLVPRTIATLLLSRGHTYPQLARRCGVSDIVAWRAVEFYGLV